MLLHPGEQVAYHGSIFDPSDGEEAKVFMTNLRIVVEFPARAGFLSSKPVRPVIDVPWRSVTNVAAIRKVFGRPLLQLNAGQVETFWKTEDAESWANLIAQMKSKYGYAAAKSTATPVVVKVAQPASTTTYERQVVKVRCRYCGGLSDELPGKCQNCGAIL